MVPRNERAEVYYRKLVSLESTAKPRTAQHSTAQQHNLDTDIMTRSAVNRCKTSSWHSLSHEFSSTDGDDFSLTCKYALATRLSLEEQEVANRNSNGKRGKYWRRYDPQAEREKERGPRGPTRSSRPLTVGEVTTNYRKK